MSGPSGAASRRDGAWALLVFAAVAAAFWFTRQAWLYGDGYQLLATVDRASELGELPVWRHTLYLPLARAALATALFDGPNDACLAVSVLSGAVLVSAVFLAGLRASGSLVSALLAALLTATAPAVWFFATTIEIHVLQGAVVAAGMLALSGAPRERAALRSFVVGAVPCAAYLAHESSPLLLPGWILLALGAGATRREAAVTTGAAAAGLAVGAVLAAVLKAIGHGAGELSNAGLVARLFDGEPSFRLLWNGCLRPYGFLGAAALIAAFASRRELVLFLAWVVPHVLFVLFVFGDPNGGGYLLATAPVLAAGACRLAAAAGKARLLLLPLAAVQAWMGSGLILSERQDELDARRQERAAAIRAALPDGGILVSADFRLQSVADLVPATRQINLWREITAAAVADDAPEAFVARVLPSVERFVSEGHAVAVDRSYRADCAVRAEICDYMDALCAALEGAYATEVRGPPDFAVLVLKGS